MSSCSCDTTSILFLSSCSCATDPRELDSNFAWPNDLMTESAVGGQRVLRASRPSPSPIRRVSGRIRTPPRTSPPLHLGALPLGGNG